MTGAVRLTMAQALLKFLDNQYVERDGQEHKFVRGVMGIFGHGNVTGIGEALEHHAGRLLFIQGKNEQGMAHAAIAYAKQRRRLGMFACTSSIGPGALNMVTAAATATVNRIPLLLLPGDIFACRQPDPVLQQLEHSGDYTISANDAFRPVSKYWDRIARPEQLMTALQHAMRVLTDPAETGAVTLSLPQDVQCEAYDYPADLFAKQVHALDRRVAAPRAVRRAAEWIADSRKPLLICGGGVLYGQAVPQLLAFAEAFRIPLGETQAGKGAVPWDHPLNMGAIGVTGSLAANRLAREADLLICVGTRLADFTTASKTAFQHPNAKFVNVNVNPSDAMKLHAHSVVADAREALPVIGAALQAAGYSSGYDGAELAALKAEWNREVDALYGIESPDGLSQTRVIGEINRFVGERDVIVCAAGSLPGDLHRLWRCRQPDTYHMEYGFSCMGYEVAGAFGTKLAEPEREVYALVGDGSFLMLHSELLTSLQERTKITVLLLDNRGYQCIRHLQQGHGGDGEGNEFRYRSADAEGEPGRLTGDYMPIDYAGYAAALGAATYTARTVRQLREALDLAQRASVSAVIDIKVLPGSHSNGYESWWRVGVAEVSENERVAQARERLADRLGKATIR